MNKLNIIVMLCLLFNGCSANKKIETHQETNMIIHKNKETKKNIILDIPPLKKEPSSDIAKNWTDEHLLDKKWRNIRNIYILQYLQNPKYILWGLKNVIPPKTSQYLKKGYGIDWVSEGDIPKLLELGFLYARSKNISKLDEIVRLLKGQGKYYDIMCYIAIWRYFIDGEREKITSLLQEKDIPQDLFLYEFDIPKNQMNAFVDICKKAN